MKFFGWIIRKATFEERQAERKRLAGKHILKAYGLLRPGIWSNTGIPQETVLELVRIGERLAAIWQKI